MSAAFRPVLDVQCSLGESPVWWPDRALLLFVDVTGRALHRFDPRSPTLTTVRLDEDVGCVALATDDGFVVGLRSGIWLLNEFGVKIRPLAVNPEDTAVSRFNDGRVDPAGRLLIGTIDEPKAGGRAALYRYDRRGLVRLTGGLLTSNGLAFSPDGRTLYHADTPRFVVYRYDYDVATGMIDHRRVFLQLEPTASDRGRPDGAAVDIHGCYWTALYEGGRIQRYDADGLLMSEHAIPVRSPTMPAFGGVDLTTLFVTTARDAGGAGGGLYALDVDVPGLPTSVFDSTAARAMP